MKHTIVRETVRVNKTGQTVTTREYLKMNGNTPTFDRKYKHIKFKSFNDAFNLLNSMSKNRFYKYVIEPVDELNWAVI